ncbi:SMC-Scp complex subunit ScpB [uncultured Enterovirga sp.]|uniref:SMC-Scp complex subunit ScpB n=1 Tax=uncultured Enterovirga sp. TaxID=2026352 RepID=UPI0035CC51D0
MNAALKRLEAISRSYGGADAFAEPETVRIAEALLFSSATPMNAVALAGRLPADTDIAAVIADLTRLYAGRGVNLVRVAGGWAFRTAQDLAFTLGEEAPPAQKLSRAAMEVLAIVAYHQPTTRADIEEIRGVAASKGTLDTLIETGWVRLRGRRRAPGRPITYGTTPAFLAHFGLDAITDLPGLEELKGLGFLEGRIPGDLAMPIPSDGLALMADEDPLEADLDSMTPYGPDE